MPIPIQIYDTYQKKLITIDPSQTVLPDTLKIYHCGITAYYYPHIGNLQGAWLADTVVKVARLAGWRVEFVENVTDVGHLVGDGDDGEDKLEKGAKRDNKKVSEIVDFYSQNYRTQAEKIGLDLPTGTFNPKATEYIQEQMILALELLKEGKAYLTEDGIYYDSKWQEKKEKTYLILHGGSPKGRMTQQQIDRFGSEKWKDEYFYDALYEELKQSRYQAIYPNFRDSLQAEYTIWQQELQDLLVQYPEQKLIIIAHSLGGTFVTKFLAQNSQIAKQIEKLYLIAPAVAKNDDFELNQDEIDFLKNLDISVEIWYSTDDKVVSNQESQTYQELFPLAKVKVFEDRGHFSEFSLGEVV